MKCCGKHARVCKYEARFGLVELKELEITLTKSTTVLNTVVSRTLAGWRYLRIALMRIRKITRSSVSPRRILRDLKKVVKVCLLLEAAIKVYDENYRSP